MIWTITSLISSCLELQTDIPYLRFYLILCFGRMYLRFIFSSGFISSLTLDEYTLFHLKAYGHISLRLGFYSSMLIFHSCGFSLNEYTNIKDSNSILENTSYIYLKIQTYVNIRPQAWHMLVSQCLIELKIQTNSSMNSTKVKTLMYFLKDY